MVKFFNGFQQISADEYFSMMHEKEKNLDLNKKELVLKAKNNIKNGTYDYLVNWNDKEYSIVHFVQNANEIDWGKNGWHLWVVENLDDELKLFYPEDGCAFIQNAVGKFGNDHHFLTRFEINDFIQFFTIGNYEMNNIKNKWYKK